MLTTLLESRPARLRRTGSTTVSAIVHGAIIASAVALSIPEQGDAFISSLPARDTIIYVPVTRQPATNAVATASPTTVPALPQPTLPALPTVSLGAVPTELPPTDLALAAPPSESDFVGRGLGAGTSKDIGGSSLGRGGEAVDVNYVERIPRVLGNAPVPRYPSALRQSGVSGQVVVRFVIDTLGRAELNGVTIEESSHPLFSEAVRNVLMQYRFAPGEVGGRKVRTMVQQPFTFTVR